MVSAAGSATTPKTTASKLSFNASTGKLTATGIENTPIGVATPAAGKFTTVNCNNIATVTSSDQSTTRIRLVNTGSGGETWDIVGGTAGASNDGLSFSSSNAIIMQLTTAGVDVTSTLTADELYVGTVGTASFTTDATKLSIAHAAAVKINIAGTDRLSVSTTGAAVTGALAIGNTVTVAASVASTHKVTMVIGGVTYYLLASNV